MFIKKITYVDFNGETRTEEFMFNLTTTELSILSVSEEKGLDTILKEMVLSKDVNKMMMFFQKIVLMSYGEPTADGRRFVKSPEMSKAFTETNAYDVLFMECVKNEEKMSEFILNILPNDLRERIGSTSIDDIKSRANVSALPTTHA